MKIIHIVTGLQRASGVTVFVENLADEQRKAGHDVRIATALDEAAVAFLSASDIVHIHGLWSPMLHRAASLARKRGIPYVISPHGMLQRWALRNKWWKKALALSLYQWRDLRHAAALHATAQSEVEDIQRLRLPNRVIVAPLGVDLPSSPGERPQAPFRTMLFVSRIQRKKGLPTLFRALARLHQAADSRICEWRLRIVGPDQEGHTAELKALASELGIAGMVDFAGPKYGQELAAEYRGADLFVLPTHSENFGSVVVEALAQGLPVITTKAAPWEELETNRSGWWVEDSEAALADALQKAFAETRESLAAMGERGRELAASRYAWGRVVEAVDDGYAEIL